MLVSRLIDIGWLAIGLTVVVQSSRLKISTAFGPGPGLFPITLGIVLVVLALVRLVPSLITLMRTRMLPKVMLAGSVPRDDALRFVLLAASPFGYAAILELLGFTISTALLGWLVLMIFRARWLPSLAGAVLAALALRIAFGTLLGVQLPASSITLLAGVGL
jgi:putative tricarboxylic transport membrane protein